MKNDTHPLEREFDMVDGSLVDEYNDEVIIPEDPTLDTIIDFALKAYKDQMDVLSLIEPKSRAKYLEIAERFLNQAKDAMHKKETIKLQRDKAQGKAKTPPKDETPSDQSSEQKKTYSREELLRMNQKTAG